MRCNNCGWDNAPGAGTCVKCGHAIQDSGGYAPNPYQEANVPHYGGVADGAVPRPTVIGAAGMGGGMQQPAPRPTVVGAAGMGGGMQQPQPRPTVVGAAGIGGGMQQPAPRPTVVGAAGMAHHAAAMQQPAQAGAKTCPQCGYPVMGDFNSCPSCGAPIGNAPQPAPPQPAQPAPAPHTAIPLDEHVTCLKCGNEVSISFAFCPKCGERIHLPTVKAVRRQPAPPPPPECQLTIVPEEDEQLEAAAMTYAGESVMLNRDNTEANNRTITSKEQAELTFKEGKWYLLNHSELNSTYVEANRPIELEPGDIIVLGDRRFKFETKEQQ